MEEKKKQELGEPNLRIGDLARRTGLTPELLRTWEARHGFPRPQRLESGHRRYTEADVAMIRGVLHRRDAGTRLEVAISEVTGAARIPLHSVYAELRRAFPRLEPHRLRKSTLLALTWAIEDECCARAQRATIFGAFQEEGYYRKARSRWNELARVGHATLAMADFTTVQTVDERPVRVQLAADSPMRREWVVVCDAPDLPAVLAAWELPGQQSVPDGERLFESLWTIDPRAVRHAARVCAHVAQTAGVPEASALIDELADEPEPLSSDPADAASLFGRVVAYVDQMASSRS
ncbi:putative sensor protein [metagenome]|uniref:Putative sensor protein n=1 Tax=metagenome TaxID=256318 RepID=A0A2P2C051_9ZZZZ